MNHSPKILILFTSILILTTPVGATAADLVMKTASDKISTYVSDIPCITLQDDAPVTVSLEEAEGVSKVSDTSGVTYSASTVQEAVDGYLRLKNDCVIQEVRVSG